MDFHPWDTMSMSEPPWKCREGMEHNAAVEYLLDVRETLGLNATGEHIYMKNPETANMNGFPFLLQIYNWYTFIPSRRFGASILKMRSKEKTPNDWVYWQLDDGISNTLFQSFLLTLVTRIGDFLEEFNVNYS